MEQWNNGTMEQWNNGTMGQWNTVCAITETDTVYSVGG
jgi:hypothetical protein